MAFSTTVKARNFSPRLFLKWETTRLGPYEDEDLLQGNAAAQGSIEYYEVQSD